MKIMNTADRVDMVVANQNEEDVKNTEKGFCNTQIVESCENRAGIVYYPKFTFFLMVSVMLRLRDVCSTILSYSADKRMSCWTFKISDFNNMCLIISLGWMQVKEILEQRDFCYMEPVPRLIWKPLNL